MYNVSVTNLTKNQYEWLIKRCQKTGLSKAMVIKLLLQEKYDKEEKNAKDNQRT